MPALLNEIYVVDAVVEECAAGGGIIVPDLSGLSWIKVITSEPCDSPILLELDRGEKHTLDMALKMSADRVIIDEKIGRNLSEYLGLSVTGTLGVLLKAKQQGLLASFSESVRTMQQQGIRYNPGLVQRLAAQAGE